MATEDTTSTPTPTTTTNCKHIPNLVSSFIDTFVDFSVSGLFLPPELKPKPDPSLNNTYSFPSPTRLIAIGDLHGDLIKTKQSLYLAGLIDPSDQDRWSGGSSTLVQVGDVLDRGGEEIKILYFLEKLRREAEKAGGCVVTMNGNHEVMNVDGDFRYVTRDGLREFEEWAYWFGVGSGMKRACVGLGRSDCLYGLDGGEEMDEDLFRGIPMGFRNVKEEYASGFRARIAALRPKGPLARRFLSKNLTVAVVGESVFVHGGILPGHVEYGFERVNQEVKDWISGVREKVTSSLVRGRNSLVWSRIFSDEVIKKCDCGTLEHVLATIPGARRMIMGHTIQEGGINGVCGNRAIRIDVGMSKGCINGLPEVLEISNGSGVRILTSNPMNVYQNGNLLMTPGPAPALVPAPKQVQVEA